MSALHAQQPGADPTLRLGPPTHSLREPFSEPIAVGELPDGRVVVADRRERTFYLVARDGRSATVLGRNGNGPNEYVGAFGIVRLPGDTLGLFGGNQRYLRLSPRGEFVDPLPIPVALLMRGGLAPARGADARGAIYWAGDVVGSTPTGFKRNQSQNVRRWRPPAERLDTVAPIADHAPSMHEHRFYPFAESDAWIVAPDGRIGVLRAAEYRLRWYQDGRVLREGPVIPYAKVPITAEDRADYKKQRLEQPAAGMRAVGPSGRPAAPSAEARQRIEEAYPDASFPTHKPPFVEGGLFLAPNGELWVVRSMPRGSRQARVDVLTSEGRRRAELDLPPGRQLVALERGGIWLARVDDDGLQWLERYDWP